MQLIMFCAGKQLVSKSAHLYNIMNMNMYTYAHSRPLPAEPSPHESAIVDRPDEQYSHLQPQPQPQPVGVTSHDNHLYAYLEADSGYSEGRAVNQFSEHHAYKEAERYFK